MREQPRHAGRCRRHWAVGPRRARCGACRARDARGELMIGAGALRTWGIAASAAMLAASLVVALTPARGARAPSGAAVELTPVPEEAITFRVRFRGGGPIARAQERAQDGAAETIAMQLRRQDAFEDLCFDRFDDRAKEVVLSTCNPVAAAQRTDLEQSWLRRLRAMRAVAYAEVESTPAAGRSTIGE